MEKYDLCVIGAGPAGYAAAMRAIDFGRKVLLIEKDKVGGAGIYDGALTSKTMWEFANKVSTVKEIMDGFGENGKDTLFADMMHSVNEAIFDRKFQLNCHIKLLEEESRNKLFYHVKGVAKLLSKNEVEITQKKGTTVIYADNIMIATGSRPRRLPDIPVDEKIIMTSNGIHHLDGFPKSLVILGAGVVGCEFATIFANLGKTKVYLIDRADRILPFEDEDVATMVAKNFTEKGIVIHKNAKLERMQVVDGEVEYELSYKNGSREVIRVEKALLSIGRVANVEDIGLENAGVNLTEKGIIEATDTQTNVPNIWAAGDVAAQIALVNVAEREGRHAVARMFGPPVKALVYKNISTIMFLIPEVAAVGLNEQEARARNIPYKVAKIDFSCIARAIAMRKTNGFFKILVTNDDEMKILGMRAVGEHSSSAIQAVALLIYMDKGIYELGNMMHPHPSIIEGIQECMRMLLGKSIYKASVFKDKLQCYSCAEGVCTPLAVL